MAKRLTSVLLIEDDENLGYILKENLEVKGFAVSMFANGNDGLLAWRSQKFDLCIIDVMLPEMDGFSVAREIRKKDKITPIVFLTARSMKDDKLKGFRAGADDYITKPFSSEELVMRLKAILRRTKNNFYDNEEQHIYMIGSSMFDSQERKIVSGNIQQRLSTRENELLKLFCENKNQLVRRQVALQKIWGNDDYFSSRSMDVFITRLRKYLKNDPDIELQNIHGTGFKLLA
jgi:two-component system OmpR family response regulator